MFSITHPIHICLWPPFLWLCEEPIRFLPPFSLGCKVDSRRETGTFDSAAAAATAIRSCAIKLRPKGQNQIKADGFCSRWQVGEGIWQTGMYPTYRLKQKLAPVCPWPRLSKAFLQFCIIPSENFCLKLGMSC